jgi:two-component system OmpR family sensor kinase
VSVSGCAGLLLVTAELYRAMRKRRKLDAARARFVNELAHDLRTPLTALRMHAELFADGRAPAGSEKAYAGTIARESARLSVLLGNLLDVSRLERGRTFAIEPVAVADVVADARRDVAAAHPARADDVAVRGDPALHVAVDRTALLRCLVNLLDNAAKHTPAGTAVTVAWEAGAVIRVADRGPGVPRRERRRLFDRYVRGRRAVADGVPGSGMGLALVRELMAGMGGRVAYEGGADGACFVLYLRESKR